MQNRWWACAACLLATVACDETGTDPPAANAEAGAPAPLTASIPAVWSKALQGQYEEAVSSVVVDAEGGILVYGSVIRELELDGQPLWDTEEAAVFVVKLDRDGDLAWAFRFITANGHVQATLNREGEVIVAGSFSKRLTAAGATLIANGEYDGFVAKLSSQGQLTWLKHVPSTKQSGLNGLTTDPAGNIIVSGILFGELDLDGIVVQQISERAKNGFVALLDTNGHTQWVRSYENIIRGVAVDDASRVYLAGFFWGAFDFAEDNRVVAWPSGGDDNRADAFLAALESDGSPRFAHAFGGPGGAAAVALALDPATGDLSLAGHCNGTTTHFPTGAADCGEVGAFVARWTNTGTAVWTRTAPSRSEWSIAEALAVTASSEVITGGNFSGLLDVGDFAISGDTIGDDLFLAKFDQAGTPTWLRRYGQAGITERLEALTLDPSDDSIVLVGTYSGSLDLGNGPLPHPGDVADIFIARLPP